MERTDVTMSRIVQFFEISVRENLFSGACILSNMCRIQSPWSEMLKIWFWEIPKFQEIIVTPVRVFFFRKSKWQTLVVGSQFWCYLSDGGGPSSIGDRWSTFLKKTWDFRVQIQFRAPPIATKKILCGIDRTTHFTLPTTRVCRNMPCGVL